MTKSALVSEHLAHVVVIAVDSGAVATARAAFPEASDRVHLAGKQAPDVAEFSRQAVDDLESIAQNGSAAGYLPALMILAETAQAAVVADIIAAIRELSPRVRPRIWPTFVKGTAKDLSDFDVRLDDLGQGACDVVLLTMGQADQAAQADALLAWLQVKVPAPASVLADLPDKQGNTCRYVALGSQSVSELSLAEESGAVGESESVDQGAIADEVTKRLARIAKEAAVVRVADDAANSVCAAAEHFDVPALLQSENNLVQAISDIDRRLVGTLESQLPAILRELIASPPVAGAEADETDQLPVTSGDRTSLITTLVQLASKGSMSRVFKKSRMTGLAEQVATAARADVVSATERVIDHVRVGVPSEIRRQLERIEADRVEKIEAIRKERGAQQESDWKALIDKTRKSVRIWTTVKTDDVQRSWGGGVPAPREYIVTASSSVIALSDKDRAMTVIDLRDDNDELMAGKPRKATVLVAQYGLPLSAIR